MRTPSPQRGEGWGEGALNVSDKTVRVIVVWERERN